MKRSEWARAAAIQALKGDLTPEMRPSSLLIYSLSLLAKSGGVIAVVTKTIRMIAA
jgi:hypothetical protein